MQYVQGIQPNVPALTTFIDIYRTNISLSSAHTWTPFHHPQMESVSFSLEEGRTEATLKIKYFLSDFPFQYFNLKFKLKIQN